LFLLLSLTLVSSVYATDIGIINCASLGTPGATYVLTSDIRNSSEMNCLQILADDVTLDCRGHTVEGRNLSDTIGIYVNAVSGANVRNCAAKNWFYGVVSVNGDYNTFINITSISSKSWGFIIMGGVGSTVRNMTVSDSESSGVNLWNTSKNTVDDVRSFDNLGDGHGFILDTTTNSTLRNIKSYDNSQNGLYLYYSDNNLIGNASTYANNFSGVYLYNSRNNTLDNITTRDNNDSGLFIYQSDANTVRDAKIMGCKSFGLNLWTASDNKISGIISHDTQDSHGVILDNSDNNTLDGIETYNNGQEGIYLYYSDNNLIGNASTYANNFSGVYLYNSRNNTLNNIKTRDNNDSGFVIYQSDANTVTGSEITGNNIAGVSIYYSTDNVIYNNFFENFESNYLLEDVDGTNYWNTTRQTGTRVYSPGTGIAGNYWASPDGDGYSEVCEDADRNGFCDLGYELAADNIDYLPLSDEYVQQGCSLAGDEPPCGQVSVTEILNLIMKWSNGQATIQEVLVLIQTWAQG